MNNNRIMTVEYKALLYNMPPVNDYKFGGHLFNTYTLPRNSEPILVPENNVLYANGSLLKCCITSAAGEINYVLAIPEHPIVETVDDLSDDAIDKLALELVENKIKRLEEGLILISNLHIFVSVVEVKVLFSETNKRRLLGTLFNRPMVFKGEWSEPNKLAEKRLNFSLDWDKLDEFRRSDNFMRYENAFQYYIKSFYESSLESSFVLLCTSLDALVGKKGNVKERIAKYSSILLCEPKNRKKYKKLLREYYAKRSEYVHGKNNNISEEDEWNIREFTRKVLILTYLMCNEAEIDNFNQLINLLNAIEKNPSLYIERMPAAYTFVGLMKKQEESLEGIFNRGIPEQMQMIDKIWKEALE